MRRLLFVLAGLAVVAVPIGILLGETSVFSGGTKRRSTLVAAHEVNVSQLPGAQSETAVAIDGADQRVLLAGSNDVRARAMAVYTSTDGGLHWSHEHLPPPRRAQLCAMTDPSVAIGAHHRQYYAFLGVRCRGHRVRSTSVYVSTRPGSGGRWQTLPSPVARPSRLTIGDDRPMVVVDNGTESPHRGRLYVGWTRFSINRDVFGNPETSEIDLVDAAAVVSHSDDGGHTWSKPLVLAHGGDPLEVRLATATSGAVYVVWRDSKTGSIYVSRSDDGSAFVPGMLVAAAVVPPGRSCHGFRASIPAQPRRCVSPNPVVSVDNSDGARRGRVYVTYGSTSLYRSQNVYLAAYDSRLRPLLGVGRPKQVDPTGGFNGPDDFLPTSATDSHTGRLWVCYYESGRGPARRKARFACTVSSDGGKSWVKPRVVAHLASNETAKGADRLNGYGDYEGVAAVADTARPVWTDGRRLQELGEETYTAELALR
jgi:hypothetical protein